jgi:cytochrome c
MNNKNKLITTLLSILLFSSIKVSANGDTENGKDAFQMCSFCHMLGEDAKSFVGPSLNNIVGASAASNIDYEYSEGFQAAKSEGLIWNEESLQNFLENPNKFVPGNQMNFAGIKDKQTRKDIIAFLKTYSSEKNGQNMTMGHKLSDAVLSIEGDLEYGEYLSSECTTCHQSNGKDDGIPNITGWEIKNFVAAMHAYKEKHRENPVMQMIAGRLNDEEIASLAEYFKHLKQ